MYEIGELPRGCPDSLCDSELHEQIITKVSWDLETVFAALLLYCVMTADTTSAKDKTVIAAFLAYLVTSHSVLPMAQFIRLIRELMEYKGLLSTAIPAVVKDNLSPAIIAEARSSLRAIHAFSQISDEEINQIMAKWKLNELDIDF